jgi:hypothetical protein
VILPPEYGWLESYLDNDTLWLEDAINWEEAFDLILTDFTIYSFLTTPFFVNSHFFLDSFVKLSFLDILLLLETNKTNFSRELYDLFIWDLTSIIYNKFLPFQFLFYTDYQDLIVIILYYSPELMLVVTDYINLYWVNNVISYTPSAVFDLFNDSLNTALSEFLEYITLFFFFIWGVVLFVNVFNLTKWTNALEIYLVKLLNYLYSTAKDARVQFESLLQTFFFFFLYWTMMIATFDDDQEELIEIFDLSFFYFFLIIIFYLFFKYSQNYFAFLEASVSEGRSVCYIQKQFLKDFINTFALLLRFFILLFRLNVYDTLDDFYDSYYIYIGDFDDDEYFNEMYFSFESLFFYDFDNNDDRFFSREDQQEFFLDLFFIYFICWGKFFTFIFFILEEILRISLAFYICFLIIFEVHSVNCSYVEDDYIQKARNKNDFNHGSFANSVVLKF